MKLHNITQELTATHSEFPDKKIHNFKFNPSIFKLTDGNYGMFYRVYISKSHPWKSQWASKDFDGIGYAVLEPGSMTVISDTIFQKSNEQVDARGYLDTAGLSEGVNSRSVGKSFKKTEFQLQ